jgi:hypothetical protein
MVYGVEGLTGRGMPINLMPVISAFIGRRRKNHRKRFCPLEKARYFGGLTLEK